MCIVIFWERIELWIEENDHDSVMQLNAPASDCDIRSLEDLTQYEMPGDFLGIYKRHNGSPHYLFNNMRFFGVQDVVSFYYGVKECLITNAEVRSKFGEGRAQNRAGKSMSELNLDNEFIPISSIDGLAALCVVLTNDEKSGNIIYFDLEEEIYFDIAPNVRSFFLDFSNDLKNNKYELSHRGLVTRDKSLNIMNIDV